MQRFRQTITVGPGSIDQFGHVNNIAYVRWIQDVAVAHSESIGLDWNAYVGLGGAFIVRRHVIDYLRPTREGEVLTLETWVEGHTRITAERATEIYTAARDLVVKASTTWVFVSLATQRPVRIPERVRAGFMDAVAGAPAEGGGEKA